MNHASLIRCDDSDDPGTPVEFMVTIPKPDGIWDVEIGRIWLDSEADEWTAIPACKTEPALGTFPVVTDAVWAVLHHHHAQPPPATEVEPPAVGVLDRISAWIHRLFG